ncbi:MAG: hypothetical protein OXE86_02040 [Alphaproteobacteria bacterium]|nr:hypothetical protein [Alphaproteobacteria bacterium]
MRNDGTVFGRVADGIHAVISPDAGPVARGTAARMLLAEQVCGMRSTLPDVMESLPAAGFLPPDPVLRMVVNRRLRTIESECSE